MQHLKVALRSYAVLAGAYLVLVLLLPANRAASHDYNLTATAYHLLYLVVIIPLIGIWFGAFYSYGRLRQYSTAIADTPEGKDFARLATGFTWLAWGSVVTSMVTIILNTIADSHHSFLPSAIVVTNYVSLAVPLISYSFISTTTRSLNLRAKITISNIGTKLLIFSFMLIGVAYCWVAFGHLDLHHITASNNAYYLPTWMMILTVIVPYLYAWFIGLLAAYELFLYSQHAAGVLYQHAIRLLSFGVISVIASSVAVQYFRTASPRIGHLSLNTTLLVVNLVYIFMATGYIFVSLGARQLRKIEEV